MKPTKLMKLRELRRHCTMENFGCSLRFTDGAEVIEVNGKRYTPTSFIREGSRIFRESWILPIIDELIEAEVAVRAKRRGRP